MMVLSCITIKGEVMKKKVEIRKNYNFLLVFMAVVLSIIGAAWYLDIFSNSSINKREVTERVITTKGPLDISLIVPTIFSSEERFGTLTLSSSEGQISVSHNGTNHPDLTSHLSDSRNDLLARINEIENFSINGYEAMSGMLEGKKYYFIYVDYAVYFLSTTSPELYDELDAIAQSFQYLGD
jgi:hypothetical protein